MTRELFNQIENLVNEFSKSNIKNFNERYAYRVCLFGYNEADNTCGMFIRFCKTFFSLDLEEILKIKNKHNLSMFAGVDDGEGFIFLT